MFVFLSIITCAGLLNEFNFEALREFPNKCVKVQLTNMKFEIIRHCLNANLIKMSDAINTIGFCICVYLL